jgi:hypothetical protein
MYPTKNKQTKTQYASIYEDAKKQVHRGKFIILSTYIRKEKRSQINNLKLRKLG